MTGIGNVMAVIPARRGSKRFPRKNVQPFAGRPLICWTLDAAIGAATITRRILSTDDEAAADIGRRTGGIDVWDRPSELAGDTARNVDVMRDVVRRLDSLPEYVVLLQPTCPLRLAGDIDGAILQCARSGADSCISVSRLGKSSYWLFEAVGERLRPLVARDERTDIREKGPAILAPNGAVFVIRADVLMSGGDYYSGMPAYYEMPRERSVDIDDELDLRLAEATLSWSRRETA